MIVNGETKEVDYEGIFSTLWGLAISLFIFPLDFFNHSAHCGMMHTDIFCYIL